MGNVSHGICQEFFVVGQSGSLLAETQSHFGQFIFQNGQFSFPVFFKMNGNLVVEHIVDFMDKLFQPAVSAPGNPVVGKNKKKGKNHQQNSGMGRKQSIQTQGRKEQKKIPEQTQPDFRISKEFHKVTSRDEIYSRGQ